MKRSHPTEGRSRFQTHVRHYHRSNARPRRSWDDWVEGISAKPRSATSRIKIIGIILAVLALSGIVAGLIIEMR